MRISPSGGSLPSELVPVTTLGLFADLGLTPGQTYYLGVIVDPDNEVPEEDEDNNNDPDGGSRSRVSFPQPIGGALSGAVTEDDSDNLTAKGTATVTDGDSEATFTAQTDTAGSYGTFNITTAGVWSYSLDNSPGDSRGDATDALKAGQTESETFPITTSDGNSVNVTITITGVNDAATFSGTQTGAVTEDATDNRATGTITVSDVDGDNALKQQADQTGSYGSLSVDHSTGT